MPGPLEPSPSRHVFGPVTAPAGEDLVAVGADLLPGTLLAAYRHGLFPMGLGRDGAGPVGWWCPDPRGVLRPSRVRVSRTTRRAAARMEVRVDTAFDAVVAACADPSRPGRWITPAVARAYGELHRLGWAHSVEAWAGGELAGGLYGVCLGGLFAGESMFHRATDASKVALVALARMMAADGDNTRLVDVQWRTPHLASLGIEEIPRTDYLAVLPEVLSRPAPGVFAGGPPGKSR